MSFVLYILRYKICSCHFTPDEGCSHSRNVGFYFDSFIEFESYRVLIQSNAYILTIYILERERLNRKHNLEEKGIFYVSNMLKQD